MKKITLILTTLIIAAIFVDCKKKKNSEEEELQDTFDKSGMLTNYANNVIIPNFQTAQSTLDSFTIAFNDFIQVKTVANLTIARQKFIRAYAKYQHVSLFEFGPSENEIVRANFNTYPTDSVQITSNINAGTYDLSTVPNLDAKGFPAIDYLLYGKNGSDASIIALFDTDAKASNRITYVNNVVSEMQTKLNTIKTTWNSSYKSTFTSSTSSDIGSSLGLLVNQLNFEIDLLKNGKIAIPLGKKSAGALMPEKCEGYYAQTISVNLIKECLANIEDVYLGRSASGSDGLGIDDYLDALKAQYTNGSLNDAIRNQFAIAKAKLNLVPDNLSDAVVNNAAPVEAAYIEIVKLLVLLKTDTPSALGIVITYQDGDGD